MRFALPFTLCFLLLPVILTAQTVRIGEHQFGIDEAEKTVLCRAPLARLNAAASVSFSGVELNGIRFNFITPVRTLRYGVPYGVRKGGAAVYELQFTELPLVHLDPYIWIPPDDKLPADFVYADDDQLLKSVIGIETRGGFTSGLPKKTYDLEFWTDTTGTEKVDVSFGGLRSDDDWILDAVYNEPLRVNAFVAHQLWLDLYRLPYAADQPEAKPGADVRWCEVFRNGKYDGVYFLSEQVDRKQLKLKKFREADNRLRGELYKTFGNSAATDFLFLPAPPADGVPAWRGFEAKYPDRDGSRWGTLYDLLDFSINANDADFNSELTRNFDLDNLVDYFLYINLTSAEDNARKNVFYARYDDDEPYLLIPWDLDGTFGNKWNGLEADYPVDSIIGNRLYDRIIRLNTDGFNDQLCRRYADLDGAGFYNPDDLNARIKAEYDYLNENGVYQREERRWPESVKSSAEHLDYTFDWNEDRASFLKAWTCDMTVPVTAPAAAPRFILSPNPSRGELRLSPYPIRPTEWSLFDLTGRQLKHGRLSAGENRLELPESPPGMYLLKLGMKFHKITIL